MGKRIISGNCTNKEIDNAYLAIDYSNKTDWVDKRGKTVLTTIPYKRILQFVEKTLTEEIP